MSSQNSSRKFGEVSIILSQDDDDFNEQQNEDIEFLQEQLQIQQQQYHQWVYEQDQYCTKQNNYFGFENYNDLIYNSSGLEAAQYYLKMQQVVQKFNLGPLVQPPYEVYQQCEHQLIEQQQQLQQYQYQQSQYTQSTSCDNSSIESNSTYNQNEKQSNKNQQRQNLNQWFQQAQIQKQQQKLQKCRQNNFKEQQQ